MKRFTTRTLFSTFLFSVLSVFLAHQANAQMALAIGPKAGVTLSTFNGTDLQNVEQRTTWLGGLFLNAQFAPALAVQAEALLTQRGGDYTSNGRRASLSINYFEIPILAKVRLPIGDVVFPHVLVGPNFSYRTNLDYTATDVDNGAVVSVNENDIRKNDIGAVLGAGIDIQTRESGIFFTIDGRYGFGFNNLDRADNAVRIRNQGWQFAVGVGFLLRQ